MRLTRVFWATKTVLEVMGRQKVFATWHPRAQCVQQRHIAQVHLDALGGVIGVEEHVDPGRFADGLVNDLAVFRHMQGERFIGDRLELDRAAHLSEFLSLILGDRGFLIGLGRRLLVPRLLNILMGQRVAGIDLEGAQELGERTSGVFLGEKFFPSANVGGRRQEAQSLVSGLIAEILWFQLPGLVIVLVGRDGIVFGLCCLAVGIEPASLWRSEIAKQLTSSGRAAGLAQWTEPNSYDGDSSHSRQAKPHVH